MSDGESLSTCGHSEIYCINPYEYIRKYKCKSCGEVMMCKCEEDFGRRFLPHQLNYGTDLVTKEKTKVTLGFQESVCNKCRGIPEEAHPRAEIHGCGTKIRRYYWREIECETIRRFGEWAEGHGYSNRFDARFKHKDIYESIEKKIIEEIKELHQHHPKYTYYEESQNDIIVNNNIDLINLKGVYIKNSGKGVKILDGTEPCSAEDFAAHYFERLGFNVVFMESSPLHALFGVFMFFLLQDLLDPKIMIWGVGDRDAFDMGFTGKAIWTLLPEDFGASGYYLRRAVEIREHFDALPSNRDDLSWLFDLWVDYSINLRQYLWAHRTKHVNKARAIISILPVDATIRILSYLIKDYWGNYLGWPDLLVYRGDEYFFAEVKSSSDKLSEDQKHWIKKNSSEIKLPFKLVKIHKIR